MSNPIPPKTHVDTSIQTSPGKKAESKETHPITDLATESLNIGSDPLDLNLDLNLDLSDLNIEILTPEDPNVSGINELSLGALNFDLPELSIGSNKEFNFDLPEFNVVTEGDIFTFIEDVSSAVLSNLDQKKFADSVQGFMLEAGVIVAVEAALAHVFYIKGSTSFVVPESGKNNFEENMAKYAEHLKVPLSDLNVIVLKDEEWNSFISKVIGLIDLEKNKVQIDSKESDNVITKEQARQRSTISRDLNRSNITGHGKNSVDDDRFTKKMQLQEEANAMEILLQERKLERAKKSREKNQRIDEKELKREIDRKAIEKNEIKIQQEKKAHSLNKKI